jgi:hypothetical protein
MVKHREATISLPEELHDRVLAERGALISISDEHVSGAGKLLVVTKD